MSDVSDAVDGGCPAADFDFFNVVPAKVGIAEQCGGCELQRRATAYECDALALQVRHFLDAGVFCNRKDGAAIGTVNRQQADRHALSDLL